MKELDDMIKYEGMENFEKIIKKLDNTPEEKRTHEFICKLIIDSYYIGEENALIREGIIDDEDDLD